MLSTDFVYLASKSPRRAELLRQIGVRFELLLEPDEHAAEALEHTRPGEAPAAYVVRVTLAKAQAAAARLAASTLPNGPILTADTTVVLGSRMLGKPATAAEAIAMLSELSGRTHGVLTAVALARGARIRHLVSRSRVRFGRITGAEIERYVAGGEPMDKAGAYAVQGEAARFIRCIDGSYSGIMGLPLYETARLLRDTGTGR
ncbi:MAG: Maf family nucleotide pyrophosphatase [Burkholderiaceae bacterium]|nr:Maf family nucleotide pyrophosphatase [Burkholderiaceae bacterium]